MLAYGRICILSLNFRITKNIQTSQRLRVGNVEESLLEAHGEGQVKRPDPLHTVFIHEGA